MNKKINSLGYVAGLLSAICVTGYVTVNKYVYSNFDIGAFEYSIFFALAGSLYGVISLIKSNDASIKRDIKNNFISLLILGSAVFIAVGLFIVALNYTTAINAAILSTTSILSTILFSYILLGEKPKRNQWMWIFTLFLGLYIAIVGLHNIKLANGDLIVLVSVLFFGFGNAYSRKVMSRIDKPGIVPDVRIAIGGIYAAIAGFFVFDNSSMLVKILPYALLSGLFYWLCLKLFAYAVHNINANEAVVLNNSHVFFTSVIGVVLLGESYSLEKLIGSVLLVSSVYLISSKRGR